MSDRDRPSTADLAGRQESRHHESHHTPDQEQTGTRRNASDAFERPAGTQSTRNDDARSAAIAADTGSASARSSTREMDRPASARDTRRDDSQQTARPSRSFPDAGTRSGSEHQPEVLERTDEGTVHARTDSTGLSEGSTGPLLKGAETDAFRNRWEDTQRSFVDEPRESVKQADELVAEVMQQVARRFADTRSSLEQQWDRGDNVSTEDLRLALQQYRDFFNRLLAA